MTSYAVKSVSVTSCALLTLIFASGASATVITYDVNLTFDPNASPTSSLGAGGPGTVTGTVTIDTSIPITTPTGNLVGVNLLEQSNNGTILSGFSNSAVQLFNSVTPYQITFIGSAVTEYPAQSRIVPSVPGQTGPYELVSFASGPVIDSLQLGPSIQFDFPYTAGGSVLPGNFDSIASTGFDAYLYGTVTVSAVPLPAALPLFGTAFAGLAAWAGRRRQS